MNIDIPAFLTYIRGQEGFFASGTVFALSANKAERICVQVLIENKVVRVPISALTNSKETKRLEDNVVCPSDIFIINQYEYLTDMSICCIDDKTGTYILTIEFDNGSQFHFIELEDGNYIIANNDDVSWGLSGNL